jgi:histone-arginine methyltransferase CARM1
MLETYILARNKFLKPGGKMFPTEAYLCIAPFYDEKVYNEQANKCNFWNNTNFYGFDLSGLKKQALEEKFRQPIIETYDPNTQ